MASAAPKQLGSVQQSAGWWRLTRVMGGWGVGHKGATGVGKEAC